MRTRRPTLFAFLAIAIAVLPGTELCLGEDEPASCCTPSGCCCAPDELPAGASYVAGCGCGKDPATEHWVVPAAQPRWTEPVTIEIGTLALTGERCAQGARAPAEVLVAPEAPPPRSAG